MTLTPDRTLVLPKGVEIVNPLTARPKSLNRHKLAGTCGILTARKSTPDPKNPGKSQEDQITKWKKLNRDKELVVWAEANEGTVSASAFGKPNKKFREVMEWVLACIETKTVSWVGFYSIDRATRDDVFGANFIQLCAAANVFLIIDDQVYDANNEDDRRRLTDMVASARHLAAKSRKATLRGLEESAEAGKPHGPECYGYEREYDKKTGTLLAVHVVEEEARAMREIAQRILAGESHGQIAKWLNSDPTIPPRRRGGPWYREGIKDYMTLPTYRGLREFTVVDNDGNETTFTKKAMWEAIIDEETAQALDRHFARHTRGNHSTKSKYLLTGVIFCDKCKVPCYCAPLTKRGKYKGMFYTCGKCDRMRGKGEVEGLEAWIRDTVNAYLSDPTFMKFVDEVEENAELDALRQKREEVAADIKNYEDPKVALSFRKRSHVLTGILDALDEELTELDMEIAQMEMAQPQNGWATARKNYERLPEDDGEANELLRKLIRIDLLPGNQSARGFDWTTILVTPIP